MFNGARELLLYALRFGVHLVSPIGPLGLGGVTRNKTHASASERMAKHALERYAPQKYKLNK